MVKCIECGLLGARNNDGIPTEVREESRRLAVAPANKFEALFICFGGNKISFSQSSPICMKQFSDERDCNEFIKWQQAFSPKEHIDMQNALLNRSWQERQAKQDHKWRKEDRNFMALVGIVTVIIGAILGAVLTRMAPSTPSSPKPTATTNTTQPYQP